MHAISTMPQSMTGLCPPVHRCPTPTSHRTEPTPPRFAMQHTYHPPPPQQDLNLTWNSKSTLNAPPQPGATRGSGDASHAFRPPSTMCRDAFYAPHTRPEFPPSHIPRPRPDARPSSYAGHAPSHPHVTLPHPAALVCKPHTCPSLMPCPRARPHSFAGHPPGRPHTTAPCPAVLVCRSCTHPSLTPHPHARLPSFACHTPAHHLCHTPTPGQPGSL